MSAELVAEVARRVLTPLTAGGELSPISPIGEQRALAALEHTPHARGVIDEVRARRVRVARRLLAVDVLGDPGPGEWLMLFSFNDLLQSMNATLPGPFGQDRPRQLLEMALRVVEAAGAPSSVGEALGRHATFSRLLEVVRVDTEVSWWVGRRVFRAARPPPRLLTWRSLRRVGVRETTVPLAAMGPAEETAQPLFEATLRSLLAASPLTDLATADRKELPFRWTGAALALVSTAHGRWLALRALQRARAPQSALAALRVVPEAIARGSTPEAGRAGLAIAELLAELERRLQAQAQARAG